MDKENFKKQVNKAIDELFAKIDELESKKGKIREDAKAEYENMIGELRRKKDELMAKFNDLKNIKDEDWDEVKDSFVVASKSFMEGISKIGDLLNRKGF